MDSGKYGTVISAYYIRSDKMEKSKKLGIAIPTYNRENYLRILLNSIPEEIEVAISDNGNCTSPEFKNEFSNREFYGTDTPLKIFDNWRKSIEHLDTEWICLASDDDIFYENAFVSFFNYHKKFPDAEIIIFGHDFIDENGKVLGDWKTPHLIMADAPDGYNEFKFGVDSRQISVFFTKKLYQRVGGLDETFKVTAADSDFMQQALINGKALFVPEIVAGYRIWTKSVTNSFNVTKEWMEEVTLWQAKIQKELSKLGFPKGEIATNTNEVLARNLLSGLYTLRKQGVGLKKSVNYLNEHKFPVHATLKTQLKILQCLLKIGLNV
jgi:GT2 family glycosyltransferase